MEMTLRQSLQSYAVNQLERFAELLKLKVKTPSSLPQLTDQISEFATNPQNLARLYAQLDEIDQHYIAEILHAADLYDLDAFEVKYGRRPTVYGFGNRFICVARLFVDRNAVHSDLRDHLLEFVPPPRKPFLKTVMELPKSVADEQQPVAIRFTEQDALNDVVIMLHLVKTGKITVSSKKAVPNSSAIKEIADALKRGDFYKQSAEEWIKPVAWATFLQTSGLCQAQDGRLRLTDDGPASVLAPPCDIVRKLWNSWISQGTVDEFRRIMAIKMEKSAERTFGFRDFGRRRNNVAKALSLCPPFEWIAVDEFFQFVRENGLHFHVTAADHALTVMNYDAGGASERLHTHWNIFQGRYILCFLLEYAASLGLIDVAFTSAADARSDFRSLPGTADISALSRYDGLRYFRVNALGRYCLGSSTEYKTPDAVTQNKLTAMSSLILSFKNEPTADAAILLNMFCDQESDTTWRLSKVKSIEASQQEFHLSLLRDFIEKHDDQPLPETLEAFIQSVARDSRALRQEGRAVLIECVSEQITQKIAEHESTRRLCRRAGEKHLVVMEAHEQEFRKNVNILGYGLRT